ncbi:fungal-specific transcription factor domain-containing protein [Xylariaceae sp. FL1651]|nr:fungal-specific transcription factor domain-containing protein [Xylariaceae sp. FL1651]
MDAIMDVESMSPNTPTSPHPHPPKRARPSSPAHIKDSPTSVTAGPVSPTAEHLHDGLGQGGSKVGQSSSFRNVSACNRCRLRKNRCDQKLPSCASCEKARVACVGYDPITKREIPRSYVYYLETRVSQLEALLRAQDIQFPPAENLEHCSRPGNDGGHARSPTEGSLSMLSDAVEASGISHHNGDDSGRPSKMMRATGGTGQRYLGSANGVSFARVVFAAVQSSVGDHRSTSDKGGIRPYKPIAGSGVATAGTSMRDSFFGLHTRPTISPAVFPDRDLALKLVDLYFEYANPQIPVLHRVDFMQMFELAYTDESRARGPRELYTLNMVFAIGGGIIMDSQTVSRASGEEKRQAQPEEYHASAIIHLEACLNGGGLEELQAVLLLASFALLRPVPPGLWYIVGVAVRLAVDLGLYYEDGKDVEFDLAEPTGSIGIGSAGANDKSREAVSRERGRREYVRDIRRRLWWCTYAFDRIVSTCVGRPFGVSDQVITTEFPSMLDDRYITPAGIAGPPPDGEPTYKVVAKHYWRLRLLQSEILQVLQYQQAQMARYNGQNMQNEYMHTRLPSPFLSKFDSFRSWRKNIDERLYAWKNSAPSKQDSGVAFSPEFLELNYWQAIIMLYRQSLSVPAMFESEYHTSKEVNSPSIYSQELQEDRERVYVKVAEAGQKVLRLYRQLHLLGLVNYTYLATHHLFMAGISYLYAIWHSLVVRSRLVGTCFRRQAQQLTMMQTMDEVDFTILAATSVFTDLIDKCPPAETCRDAFDRTAKATIKMANSNGGFGQVLNRNKRESKGSSDRIDYLTTREATANRYKPLSHMPADQSVPRSSNTYEVSPSETYNSHHSAAQAASMHSVPPAPPYRLNIPNIKSEHDGYSMNRPMPLNAGGPSEIGPIPDNSAIDPVLLPSHSPQMNSPASVSSMTPKSAHQQFTPQGTSNFNLLRSPPAGFAPPSALTLADLQGMDFLQNLQDQSGVDGLNNPDMQMDMGFGIGWEGMHHDFSEGQQFDLFDGFFFGAQQGGNGGGI